MRLDVVIECVDVDKGFRGTVKASTGEVGEGQGSKPHVAISRAVADLLFKVEQREQEELNRKLNTPPAAGSRYAVMAGRYMGTICTLLESFRKKGGFGFVYSVRYSDGETGFENPDYLELIE